MDRIREAITRARDEKTKPLGPATHHKAPPQAQQQHAAGDDAGPFIPVQCNFEDFGKYRIISNEQDPVLNAYRVLRTRVIQKMSQHGWRTLAVVSPTAGAGKTVTAINLAIAISAKEDSRITLADLDFYRPSLARYLGLKDFPSILDYFEDKRSVEGVTLSPDLNNLLLIANERVTRRGAEYLTSSRIDPLIDTAVNSYQSRVVIFDMSPLLGCDDTISFLPKVDCVLLVAASGQTSTQELKEAKRILGGANIVGTVLNKAPASFLPNQFY